jgi:hypothetical protein
MSHIVAIFGRFTGGSPLYSVAHSIGLCDDHDILGVCNAIAGTGQSVERLPEVGECILVDPPAPPVEPPPIDWWMAQRDDRAVSRGCGMDVRRWASMPGYTGVIGHIWRDDDGLHETWERVK